MRKVLMLLFFSLSASSQNNPGVLLSASLNVRDYQPEELIRIKVTIENIGDSDIRVPRQFPNAIGFYPSTRISFTSANGVEEWSGAPEGIPESRHLKTDKLEESTLKLSGKAFYGTEVLASAPRARGCYQMKVYLNSWDAPDKALADSILFGNISSAPILLCVTSKATKVKPARK